MINILIIINNIIQMFKYIKLADYLQTIIHRKCQLKDIIYADQQNSNGKSHNNNNKNKKVKVNPAVAYSNLSLILNNISKFEQMYKQLCTIMKKRKQKPVSNKYLLFVMVAELINVGKIVGGGQLKRIIMENHAVLPNIQVQSKINKQTVNIRLRHANTLDQQYNKYKQILSQYQSDQTIPHLYNLNHLQYSKLIGSCPQIRNNAYCVIQSFSSNLPSFALFQGLETNKNKNIKFDIIDACSAPGNKTLQLSEYLGDRGNVYAFEKDERRFNTLNKNMKKHLANNVTTTNMNFLQVNPLDQKYRKVKLILLDPSCSGSGMLTNFTRDDTQLSSEDLSLSFAEYVQNKYNSLQDKQKERVLSLKKFQLQLLNHAVKFSPQRISYSTCSIYVQQNQQVVSQFLNKHPQYCIKAVTKYMKQNKSILPGFGKKYKNCIRIDPRQKISDGFFVCIFGKKKQIQQNNVN